MKKLLLLIGCILFLASPCWAAFPTTGILDNLNRSNEDPLSQSGNWATISYGAFKVVGNQCVVSSADGAGEYTGMRYSAGSPGSDNVEVYITFVTLPANDKLGWLYILTGTPGSSDGYGIMFKNGYQALMRQDDGADVILAEYSSAISNGDVIGFERINDVMKIYINGSNISGSGINSSVYDVTGYDYELWTGGSGAGNLLDSVFDNFGGGTVTSSSTRRIMVVQ